MRKLLAPAAFCLFTLTGYLISMESWNGNVFVYLGEQRAPAAIRSMRDYSAVDRKALYQAVHRQLLEGARMIKGSGEMGLALGHPLIKGDERTEFACPLEGRPGLFDTMEVTFYGLGISSAGQQPAMTIVAECQSTGSLNRLDTVWIPMKDIMAAEAKDQDLQIYGEHPVSVRLQYMPGEWPAAWVLSKVRLFKRDEPEEQLLIDADKMREANGKLMSFEWHQ